MLQLGGGQMAQNLGADRLGVALGQGQVGVVALHLGLPVAFKGGQNLFQPGAAHCCGGHEVSCDLEDTACFLALVTSRIRLREWSRKLRTASA